MSQKPESSSDIKKNQKKVETAFLVLGIGSLLPWNAIISEFDFFMHYQKGHSPQTLFPNINFALNLAVQLILLSSKSCISYKSQLLLSQIIPAIGMILLPFCVILLSADMSFYVSCGIMVLVGIANALASSSIFGLASFFPVNNVIAVGAGQGYAGILLNILRYIILYFFNGETASDINNGAYLFFFVSVFILIISMIFSCMLYNNEYFLSILNEKAVVLVKKEKKETKKGDEELLETGRSSINDEPEEEEVKVSSAEVSDKKVQFSFRALMCKLIDINLLCATGFIITFMLFPGASIKPQLFNLPIGWKINTIIFLFNVFDTIAKTLVGYLTPTKGKLYFFSFSRILLICSFYYVCYAESFNLLKPEIISYIVLVNVILLSMTGGFVNSLSFALAPGQVQDEWKGKAGSSVSLSLIIGICLGSFSGIIFNNLIDFKVPIPVEPLVTGKKGNM